MHHSRSQFPYVNWIWNSICYCCLPFLSDRWSMGSKVGLMWICDGWNQGWEVSLPSHVWLCSNSTCSSQRSLLQSLHLAAGPELDRHNCCAERLFYDLELKNHLVKMSTMWANEVPLHAKNAFNQHFRKLASIFLDLMRGSRFKSCWLRPLLFNSALKQSIKSSDSVIKEKGRIWTQVNSLGGKKI